MRPVTNEQVRNWCAVFGIDLPKRIVEAKDQSAEWETIKLDVKAKYRELAKAGHPDHGGDEEKWKEITAAYNAVQDLVFRCRRPIRPMVGPFAPGITVRFYSGLAYGSTIYTSTTSSTGW